eukprot:scaffold31296_cov62-Cyclotella_meneghiniana.AAC.7
MPLLSDAVEIAALVSERAGEVLTSYIRAGRVHEDGRTIEIAISMDPIGYNDIDKFWPADCSLSDEKKRSLLWQYQRSMGCGQYAAILAK